MAAHNTGVYDIQSLLAARFTSVNDFGFENIREILNQELMLHNMEMLDVVSEFGEVTTEKQGINGSSTDVKAQEVGTMGRGATQEEEPGSTVGFPLKKYQWPTSWTKAWLSRHTAADMAVKQQSIQTSHRRQLVNEVKRAMFESSNYSFIDIHTNRTQIDVKRLYNADGTRIPNSPQSGDTIDGSTHTHYLANATLTTTVADQLLQTVREHGVENSMSIAINVADEQSWRGLTGFVPLQHPDLEVFRNNTAPDVPFQRLDPSVFTNRIIGRYSDALVWLKSWGIPNYALAWDSAQGKTCGFRQDTATTLQGLQFQEEVAFHPLRIEFQEALFGVGVWNRGSAAVLYHAGGAYVDPSIS